MNSFSKMSLAEAKLMVALGSSEPMDCNPQRLSLGLEMNYYYICRVLRDMVIKGWITRIARGHKAFYRTNSRDAISKADDVMFYLETGKEQPLKEQKTIHEISKKL